MRRLLTAAAALALVASAAAAQPHRDGRHDGYRAHADWRNGGHISHHDWNRGARIDWRARHLRRPPRGYEWREVDGNYVLAAAATGLIASAIIAASH